jgi:chromosome segregation ATPase
MSMPRDPVSSSPSDLETTAELPALDVTAYEAGRRQHELSNTDTWVAPAPAPPRPGKIEQGSTLQHSTHLEDGLKALSASLKDFEARLAAKDERLSAIEGDLESARRQQAAAEQRAETLGHELTDARLALSTARAQVDELTRRLESRDAAARTTHAPDRSLEARLAERERALARAEQRLEHIELQATAHVEALQSAEGRHGVLHTLLRDLDAEVGRRDSRIEELQSELQAAREGGRRQIGALQVELVGVRLELTERTTALQQQEARHAERSALLDAGTVRIAELEAQMAEQAQSLQALKVDIGASRERVEAAEGDLHAAEESLRQLEGEIRAKNARIDELTKLNDDWRATLEEARQSLEERDALIRRLEADTVRSTVLLESIQHSMRLPDETDGGDLAPDGATRLLIRADGESEVVHVLGRRTSLGRTPDNDVQIDTKFVSRHHAIILAGPLETVIEDLNSTNGVLVNGRRVTRQRLKDGDAVKLGKTQFRFVLRSPGERRASQ